MIALENVSKSYAGAGGETIALRGLSLEVKTGELVALLGPSGCGKTTTLMTIAGFLKPNEGRVLFDGIVVNDLAPKDRNIGMVFQSYALYPHLCVMDNIAFPLKYKGVDRKTRYERAREVARTMQIEDLLSRKPSQLSGGQQQRVAMARALVKQPVVLLLDEPMSNLDARLKLDVRDEIRLLQKRIGVTTIIVTHDQEEAMAMADRVAVLDKGCIQQYGTPDELYWNPANLFVANFLGNPPMNMIDGELTELGGGIAFRSHAVRYRCPAGLTEARPGAKVKLGVRPDHLRLVERRTERSFPLTVEIVEHMGGKLLVKASIAGPEQRASLRILVAAGGFDRRAGDTIDVEIEDGRAHLFDVERGGAALPSTAGQATSG